MEQRLRAHALRLSEARRASPQSAATTSVIKVATSFDFRELGRFSVKYRQQFGESPSVCFGMGSQL